MKTRAAHPFRFKCCGLALRLFATLLIVAAPIVSCTSPQPEDGPAYRSEQGYSIGLPAQWLVVHRLEIDGKENPIGTDNPRIRNLFTAEVLKALKEKALASGVELFLNLETSDESFIESINVQTARGSIAVEERDVGYACAETEKRLTALYGNPVKISACKALKIRRMPAFYMEYQVEKPAMAHFQYLIQLKADRYTVMTLTCRPSNTSKLRPEFDAIVASFRPT